LENALVSAKNILLLIHKNPDGDALGGMLALFLVLNRIGKKVTPACADPVTENLLFLPCAEKVVTDFEVEDFDLVVVLDCGDSRQTKFYETKPRLWDGSRKLIKIDHHTTGVEFGDIQLVFPEKSATCEILFEIFLELGIKIRPDIATCLLTGISTDTGSFRHSNTTPNILRLAAKLLRYGANLSTVTKKIYRTTPLPSLKLWGQVLKNLQQTKNGITMAVVQKKDFMITNAVPANLSGIIDLLSSVPNSQFTILLSEQNGIVKGSLRTLRDDIDVAKIAKKFGGGGHTQAAGFVVPGKLEQEVRWRVV
jgi:bifunctional oligoribonuclease and PAP phosphatase NrnA